MQNIQNKGHKSVSFNSHIIFVQKYGHMNNHQPKIYCKMTKHCDILVFLKFISTVQPVFSDPIWERHEKVTSDRESLNQGCNTLSVAHP